MSTIDKFLTRYRTTARAVRFWTQLTDLTDDYHDWCEDQKLSPESRDAFQADVKGRPDVKTEAIRGYFVVNLERVRG